ncbi:MAG: hypothetical protein RML93_07035, partial [Anaerolineales bacterium]|nr:hypothetical protein [Anaerolineales bacterium]MDW8447027.1 hypothetical protein [Anaerolineales bacterium]
LSGRADPLRREPDLAEDSSARAEEGRGMRGIIPNERARGWSGYPLPVLEGKGEGRTSPSVEVLMSLGKAAMGANEPSAGEST